MGAAAGGTGTFGIVVQNGGSFISGNTIFMAANAGTTSNITVTGANSTLTNTGHFVVGGSGISPSGVVGGTATLTVASGGAVSSVAATTTMALFATGTVNVNTGGTLSINSLSDGAVGSSGTVNLASGTVLTIADGTFTDSSATPITGPATFSGVIAGAGGIAKNGTGVQNLAGANTHSGGTTVNGGTLGISNANALGTGNIAVNTGAILNSTVAFAVPNGAVVSGAGTITSTGNITMNGGSTLRGGAPGTTGILSITTPTLVALSDGTTPEKTEVTFSPSANSLVAVNGIVNFNSPGTSAAKFVINVRSLGLTPNTPVTGTIVTATGGFQSDGTGPIPSGTAFTQGTDFVLTSPDFASFTNVSLTVAGGGQSLVLQFTPVPEPVTLLGVAAGGAFLFRLRRRVV
jgi:autotransporter-associated beta strand protein/T5SS/PEP-CTERM-associated repeat protein